MRIYFIIFLLLISYNTSYWSYLLWSDYIFARVSTSEPSDWYKNYKIQLDNYVFLSDSALKDSIQNNLIPFDYNISIYSDVNIKKGDLLILWLPHKWKLIESTYVNKLSCENWKIKSSYTNQVKTFPSSEEIVSQFNFINSCDEFNTFFEGIKKGEVINTKIQRVVIKDGSNSNIGYKYLLLLPLFFIFFVFYKWIKKLFFMTNFK